MVNGWVKIHKKFKEWEWYKKPNTAHLFIHLILNANYEDKVWRGLEIKRGQIVTGSKTLSVETGLTLGQIKTSLNHLLRTSDITIKTTNKYSIITITKYDSYQGERQANDKQNATLDATQTTTTKEIKKERRKNINSHPLEAEEIINHLNNATQRSFKINSDKTGSLIKARLREGFSIQDFKTVIDNKVREWSCDERMANYLRPSTLFGKKFEEYLQQDGALNTAKKVLNNPSREQEATWLDKITK